MNIFLRKYNTNSLVILLLWCSSYHFRVAFICWHFIHYLLFDFLDVCSKFLYLELGVYAVSNKRLLPTFTEGYLSKLSRTHWFYRIEGFLFGCKIIRKSFSEWNRRVCLKGRFALFREHISSGKSYRQLFFFLFAKMLSSKNAWMYPHLKLTHPCPFILC